MIALCHSPDTRILQENHIWFDTGQLFGGKPCAYCIDGHANVNRSLRSLASLFAPSSMHVLGWLILLESHQCLLNRYGTHDQINTSWKPWASLETTTFRGSEMG